MNIEEQLNEVREQLAKLEEVGTPTKFDDKGFSYNDAETRMNTEEKDRLYHRLHELEALVSKANSTVIGGDENVVNIGDEITLKTSMNGEVFEENMKLVSVVLNPMHEISIDSAVGKAIVGQMIGSSVVCQTPNGMMNVEIISKKSELTR